MIQVDLKARIETLLKQKLAINYRYCGTNTDGHMMFKNKYNFKVTVTRQTQCAIWVETTNYEQVFKY